MAIGEVDDLASLQTLDENTILEHLRSRYHNDIIYTYIGDILVAVNPYKKILIYSSEHEHKYTDVKIRSQLPPHLYAISDAAYQKMRRTGHPQCCVVSGESGAGKTESTKLMVQHIVHLCRQRDKNLHEKIVQVNPLLEAFGNAQTVMNNNSSRFGKYIELDFSHEGELLGARLSEYLMEKSRVVSQGPGERNFHIFYYLFAGLTNEQLRINMLDRPENHRIMRPADNTPIFSNDAEFHHCQEMWDRLRGIMDIVGFLPEEVNMILALLASVLHITDIVFEYDYDTDGVYIVREEMLELAAELLAIQPMDLAASLISNVTILRGNAIHAFVNHGERIVSLKNIEQANDGRDALAKSLYGRLFGWIVRQINFMIQPDRRAPAGPCIGILDIAGFENFEQNSFEQLCINAANEQLQFYFNQHIFQWEMDEYKKEGIKGKDIKFVDNRPLIDMFLETPLGLFSLLDEESKFPQATDGTLLEKLGKNFAKKAQFSKPKGNIMTFTISHYAGPVVYTVYGFLEKNRDTLSSNLFECMIKSDSQIVVDLFTAGLSDTGALMNNPNAPKRSRKSLLLCKPMDLSSTKTRSLSKKAGKKLKESARQANQVQQFEGMTLKTLAGHFRSSLTDLMSKLLEAEPQFVRCIKPNHQKRASSFQPEAVMTQLKYTGILETVKIRRQGYATRIPHNLFFERYKILVYPMTAKAEGTISNCSKILKKFGLKDWEIGKTKVFLKYWHPEQLDLAMNKIGWQIVDCQRIVRGFVARRKFRKMAELSKLDKQAVRGFSVYIGKESDDRCYQIQRQKEHDTQRYNKMMTEYDSHRAMSPVRNTRRRSPSPKSRRSRDNGDHEAIYMPTPLLLGNPVYGSGKPLAAGSNYGTGGSEPRQAYRRQSFKEKDTDLKIDTSNYEYPTLTSYSPGKSPRTPEPYDYNPTSHLARPGAVPQAALSPTQKQMQNFMESIMAETLLKFADMDSTVWAKIYYLERSTVVAKVYLREHEIILDNSLQEYDGFVIGLGAFENDLRDEETDSIRAQIGKGIKLSIDNEGNIYAKKVTQADIIVKGYKNPANQSLSSQVIKQMGRLTSTPVKVFDMKEFKNHLAHELERPQIDERRLQRLTMISFSFVRNTFQDLDTPCWVTVINFRALDMLGKDHTLREIAAMARLSLGEADEKQLKRSWASLNLRSSTYAPPDGGRQSRADFGLNNNVDTIMAGKSAKRSGSPGYAESIAYDPPMNNGGFRSTAQKKDWAKLRAQKRESAMQY